MDVLEKAILIEKAKEYAEGYDALRRHVEVLEERMKRLEQEHKRDRKNIGSQYQRSRRIDATAENAV
jgi:hypothetical protein